MNCDQCLRKGRPGCLPPEEQMRMKMVGEFCPVFTEAFYKGLLTFGQAHPEVSLHILKTIYHNITGCVHTTKERIEYAEQELKTWRLKNEL